MISILSIGAWLGTLWGRVAIGAGAIVMVVGLRACDVQRQRAIGAESVVDASKQKGRKANARNDEVRRRAREPGAFDRLRRDDATCRDC